MSSVKQVERSLLAVSKLSWYFTEKRMERYSDVIYSSDNGWHGNSMELGEFQLICIFECFKCS